MECGGHREDTPTLSPKPTKLPLFTFLWLISLVKDLQSDLSSVQFTATIWTLVHGLGLAGKGSMYDHDSLSIQSC